MTFGDHEEVLRHRTGLVTKPARVLHTNHCATGRCGDLPECEGRSPSPDQGCTTGAAACPTAARFLSRTWCKCRIAMWLRKRVVRSLFTSWVKVRQKSVMPARRRGLLDAPSVGPIAVILSVGGQDFVHAWAHRAVHCFQASEAVICVRRNRRLDARWQAHGRCRGCATAVWWCRRRRAAGNLWRRLALPLRLTRLVGPFLVGRRPPVVASRVTSNSVSVLLELMAPTPIRIRSPWSDRACFHRCKSDMKFLNSLFVVASFPVL